MQLNLQIFNYYPFIILTVDNSDDPKINHCNFVTEDEIMPELNNKVGSKLF